MSARRFAVTVAITLLVAAVVARATSGGPWGPVSAAARTGDLGAVQRHLASGGDPNLPDGPRGFRPLATAARESRLDVMEALLSAGADPNLPDAGGNRWIPLMHAVHKHQLPAVHLLLRRGAAPDGTPGLALTPLMMAVASGQTEIAKTLLAHGADPRRRGPGGLSLLTLALSGGALTDLDEPLLGGCHPETVRLLRATAPDVTLDKGWRGDWARFFAKLNKCQASLALVR
jgi:ankyrin repeat protein